ncbi:DUF6734 family protein [Chitinophaga sp. RAB17]|uniref:DUF6734 family protein n=1 Tax=Chitinophaga sp. RAB17 TaxID=3233049 RepID=UPI003F8D9F4F
MKIVQSFWSKPSRQSNSQLVDARFNGGWLHRSLNYYSWALSCLQLRKYYDSVELVTDEWGKEILIDKLNLPYTKVTVALDELNRFDAGMWTMGKVYAYGLQQEPFIHVDSDVFIWKPFEDDIVNAALVAQNLEEKGQGYSESFLTVCDTFSHVPEYFQPLYDQGFSPSANAGILGGNNIPFMQNYVREVFSFLDNNKKDLDSMIRQNAGNFSVVCEQVIFYSYAKHCGVDIGYLLPATPSLPPDIGYFHMAEQNRGLVHCVSFYKRDLLSYATLKWRLWENYPAYYNKINKLIADAEI